MSYRRIVNTATRALRMLDAAVMPACCVFCGSECGSRDASCCSPCFGDLPWIDAQCGRCAEPFKTDMEDGAVCGSCLANPPPFVTACVPLEYTFPVDAAIKSFKFRRRLDYLPLFAAILSGALQTMPQDIDALLPVPLHRRRHVRRGFNQAVELCRPLAAVTGLPMITSVRRVRATPYQSGLTAAQRRHNLRAAFALRGALHARHVVIVDDVITTGETCRQIARVVRRAGVPEVSVLAIARAGHHRHCERSEAIQAAITD